MSHNLGNEYRQGAVYSALDEMGRQDRKWGEQRSNTPEKWVSILGEEFGEVCRGVLEDDIDQYREELVHVAAVALRAVQNLDEQWEADRIVNALRYPPQEAEALCLAETCAPESRVITYCPLLAGHDGPCAA